MNVEIEKLKAEHRLAIANNETDKLEILEHLLRLVEAAKPHCMPTSQLNMRVNEALDLIKKFVLI